MIVKIKKEAEFKKSDLEMPYSLFPLANISFYGLSNKIFSLYRTGNCYFSKYDDSIQICSANIKQEELDDVLIFIKKQKIRMITGEPGILLTLSLFLNKHKILHKLENGYIFQICKFGRCDTDRLFETNNEQDFKTTAHIVCLANSNHHHFYKEQQLFDQYYQRFKSGYCRSFHVKDNGILVGSISTYCETAKYCVIGGLAVHPDFQKKGYGKALFQGALNKLHKENKSIFLFCYNTSLFDFYSNYSINSTPISKILVTK